MTHRALPQFPEMAGRLPERFIEQPHTEVAQVVLLQVQLCQAGTGTEQGGQFLAAARCESTSDQPVGEICTGPQSF